MTDIASLGIEIKTDSVKQAADDLDRLNQAGASTEQAANKAGAAWSNAASQMGRAGAPAKQMAQGFNDGTQAAKDQQKALADLLGKIDPVVGALGRLDDMEQQLRKHAASGLLPKDDFDEYAKKIQVMRDGLAGSDDQFKKTGVSAAQTAAALRMLPAQFTDIFTQLAGGANPLLVLIQQGGQIKDSFGGIGNTFDVLGGKVKSFFGSLTGFNTAGVTALGGALSEIAKQQENIAENSDSAIDGISGTAESVNNLSEAADTVKGAATGVTSSTAAMVGGFLAAAAALAALAVAYKQGSDEQTAYAKALILTGNAAGVTTDQLADLARQVGSETGTIHDAADALTQFAATGKFASSQLGELATAALNFEDATGKAVSETVKEFARLADDPVKASQQLNEQYHYLTAAVYEQIAALQEQGRTNDAAQVAEKAYAEALDDRATKVKESLGTIETAWNSVKDAAKRAWDAALNVGREETLDQRIERLKQQLQEVANLGSAGAQGRARFQLGLGLGGEGNMRQQLADAEAQKEQEAGEARWAAIKAQANKDSIDAQREISAMRESMLSKEQRRDKEIQQYYERVAKIREANPFTTLFSQSDIDKDIAGIRAKYAERVAKPQAAKAYTDDAATRMLQSLRETGAELQAQLGTQDKLTAAQSAQAKFQQLITDLKSKTQLTADQKSLLANQDAIKAQLAKNVAIDQEIQKRQQLAQIQSYQDALSSKLDTEKQGYQQQLEGIGKGSELRQRLREQLRIQQDYQRDLARLQSQYNRGQISEDQYRQETDLLNKSLDERLKAWDDYYKKLKEKQKDWTNGAKDAFQDYVDDSKNAAKTYYDLFKNALQGTEDALTKFVMTGKLSFSDLANSIIEDLVRIQVRKAIAFGVESFQGSSLFASIFGGAQNVGSAASAAGYSTAGYAGAYGFDGGGYTGDLPRLGGVDGKGGFMAILHPQETVIDHTKPSRTQGGNSTSNTFHINVSGGGSERENKQAGATIGREINRVIQRSARYA